LYKYLERHVEPEQSFRGKLLLFILLALNGLNALIFVYFYFVAGLQMDNAARVWALQLIAGAEVFYFALLMTLLRGYFRIAAGGSLLAVTGAAVAAIGLTGGAPVSPALPFLLLPAIFAFCILGPRGGVLVSGVVASACGLQWFLSTQGL